MLENVKTQLKRLIAAYESEKQQRMQLETELDAVREQNDAFGKRIVELERELDNLKLKGAFTASGDNAGAKRKIDGLIKEIDKCISLMEG